MVTFLCIATTLGAIVVIIWALWEPQKTYDAGLFPLLLFIAGMAIVSVIGVVSGRTRG